MKIALVLLLLFASAEAVQAQSAISPEMQSGALWQRQTTSTPTIEVRNTGVLGDGSHDYRYPGFWVGAGTGVGLAYIAH